MESTAPILVTKGLCKRFGSVEAVRNVDWQIYPGKVMALVGDNGAGKSTLIKLITGAYMPDAGEILIRGENARIKSPTDSLRLGIAPVYQDLALVESRDVMMNMFLGTERTHGPFNMFLNKKGMRTRAHEVLSEIHSRIADPNVPVSQLSGGQRQVVAVGRALVRGGDIIILDEPTAALGVEQTQEVLQLIETLRSNGKTVIFISHNLSQVMDLADWISVMFHGEMIATRPRSELTRSEVVSLIMGAEVDAMTMA
ncbi:MAG: sugar ABC transporter ATP-binding protein [Chloroflexi bacterium]|nr:sugar ABC transporter ATP-binding protein [Chloroflexota bacterium]